MAKLLILLCAYTVLNTSFAAIETNRRSGHGLFHGLKEETGKSSWLEESKLPENSVSSQSKPYSQSNNDHTLTGGVVQGNGNGLLDNSDSKLKHSSIFLQPEPRGLQYMLNTGDYNPYLMHYMGKRAVTEFVGEPYKPGQKQRCDGRTRLCLSRNRRQINLQPGNVIPGSNGQAVLYGVPGSSGGPFPSNNGYSQGLPNTNFNYGVPQGSRGGPGNSNQFPPQGGRGYGNQGYGNQGNGNQGYGPQGYETQGYKTHGY